MELRPMNTATLRPAPVFALALLLAAPAHAGSKKVECPWSYGPKVELVHDFLIVDGKEYPVRTDAERLEFARILRACDANAAIPMLEARAGAGATLGIGVALLVLGIVFLLFLSVYGGVSGIAGGIGLILLGHVNMSGATRRAIDEIEQSGNEVETAPPPPVS